MSNVTMNIETFMSCAQSLPANISILVRGDHGIGKSQCVFQLGKHYDLPVLDKRLSQMSEGDIVGLPKVEDGVTKFLPPDWYMEACKRPCILFLDELNRATPEVMQAAFQIALDRTHLSGWKLHEKTRIYAAINTNQNYQVNEMDPALLDRFWVADLVPTVEEWLEGYAKNNLHEHIYNFIKINKTFLDPPEKSEASSIEPTRRSYERLNNSLLAAGIMDEPTNSLFFNICRGFIGNEASIMFSDYVKNSEKQISALDIVDRFAKNKEKIMSLGQEKWNICIDKLIEHLKESTPTAKQLANIKEFTDELPDELFSSLYTKVMSMHRLNDATTPEAKMIVKKIHALNLILKDRIVKINS